jgi:hypothetical protein
MAEYTVDGLAELSSPAANDEIGIWDVSAGQYLKIRRDTLVGGTVTGGGTIATGGYTLTVPATGTAALITTGTWTPQLLFGYSGAGITYGLRTGNWCRIGSLIFVEAITILTNKGTATGTATLDGLPFTPVGAAGGAILNYCANLASISGQMFLWIRSNGISFGQGDGASAVLTDANFTNTTRLDFCGVYLA